MTAPIQLPLFAEAALTRIRPERNEWRYYRLEVWPDLFGRALLSASGAASAPKAAAGSIRIPIRAPPSMPSPAGRAKRRRGYRTDRRRLSTEAGQAAKTEGAALAHPPEPRRP